MYLIKNRLLYLPTQIVCIYLNITSYMFNFCNNNNEQKFQQTHLYKIIRDLLPKFEDMKHKG